MVTSLNTRFSNFVTWIRPDPATVEDARKQRDEVRDRIRGKAEADGLTVRSTPDSGSFAKSTGLRRHMLGGAEHEGQDIDCPFIVSPRNEQGDVLSDLLGRFDRYARESYPDTPRERTKSAIRLSFVRSKLRFDLVPMMAVGSTDTEQLLLRADGERRRTSIQQHRDFVKARTKRSQDLRGSVAFNDCVRLMKWWREHRATQSKFLTEVPTFLVDLLCAKAFDEVSVQTTYPATLVTWFDKMQSQAALRTMVVFHELATPHPERATGAWKVIDPVNGENNVVPASWGGMHIDEFRDWARAGRDKLQAAIACDMRGRDSEAVTLVTDVLGPSFRNHSEA